MQQIALIKDQEILSLQNAVKCVSYSLEMMQETLSWKLTQSLRVIKKIIKGK